jgi:AAA ATPase-like protein
MPQTLGALLAQQAAAITGRDHERAQLRRLLEPGGPVVAYVHGLAGVGKTTLLHAFASDARAAGFATVEIDGHVTYSTRGAFLAALTGSPSDDAPALDAVVASLEGPRLLVVDTFELLAPVDEWVCRTLIPALPEHVRVVIAGRDAPAAHWRSYGRLLSTVPLVNLRPKDAVALLREQGIDAVTAPRINSIARGHPLSLQLAAGALRDRPGLALEEIAAGTVGEELAGVYLDGLDAKTRRALDVYLAGGHASGRGRRRRVRTRAAAAVRRARSRRAARPRHRPGGRGRTSAGDRSAGVLAHARGRVGTAARGAAPRTGA